MRYCAGSWSKNVIIGLTNISPNVSRPTLWNYAVCSQYEGTVGGGETVAMYCYDGLRSFRYVIVQLPSTDLVLNFCELQVFVKSMSYIISYIRLLKLSVGSFGMKDKFVYFVW